MQTNSVRRPLPASPRITARELNRLRDIEERIAVLGRAVALGGANRGMVADRIQGALVGADLAGIRVSEQKPIENRDQRYYAANREKVQERQRQYYIANREAMLERQRAYYVENRERELERQRLFHFANRERILERKRTARAEARGGALHANASRATSATGGAFVDDAITF